MPQTNSDKSLSVCIAFGSCYTQKGYHIVISYL